MEIYGRNSCTRNPRHINITYFWAKVRVDNKEVRIVYIYTDTFDFGGIFTLPLQEVQFNILRA